MEVNNTSESIRQRKIGKPISDGGAGRCIHRETRANRVSQRRWRIKSEFVAFCSHDCNVPQLFEVLNRRREQLPIAGIMLSRWPMYGR